MFPNVRIKQDESRLVACCGLPPLHVGNNYFLHGPFCHKLHRNCGLFANKDLANVREKLINLSSSFSSLQVCLIVQGKTGKILESLPMVFVIPTQPTILDHMQYCCYDYFVM